MSKVWLITGANSGFGRAFAEAAIAAGDVVVAAARRTETLDDLVAAHPDQVEPVARHVPAPAPGGRGGAGAAALARRAAEAARPEGRPLAAAQAELPWPEAPHLVLWQAATILREHRGDGHLAALLAAGLDPAESLVSFAAIGAAPEPVFESRGWSAAEWAAARARLTARGLLDPEGAPTDAGRALRAEVERRTDELAAAPWEALGAEDTARLADLLGGPWLAMIGSGLLPAVNTLGIGKV
ncbi:hypothetical protein ACFU8I_10905 [Streptomyces sp. NPDC057540]|uniref:SCO6745 family protein n=1 Tax=Streptomyces sp. NPDC057540 TaxID=3346160 RepID=UPI00369B639A